MADAIDELVKRRPICAFAVAAGSVAPPALRAIRFIYLRTSKVYRVLPAFPFWDLGERRERVWYGRPGMSQADGIGRWEIFREQLGYSPDPILPGLAWNGLETLECRALLKWTDSCWLAR